LEAGLHYNLKVYKIVAHGAYLEDNDSNEILLPSKNVPATLKIGDYIRVFVYEDSDDRLIATTQVPKVELYGFSMLTCVNIRSFGAFMEWGVDRDLLVPNAEMIPNMQVGKAYITYLYQDEKDRLTGTTLIDRCLQYEDIEVQVGEQVELMIYGYSDFGPKAIINQTYNGQLYNDDVYQSLKVGQIITGYIRKIRPDKKIDVTLRKFGYKKVLDETGKILEILEQSNGFIPLHDKSSPEDIKRYLGMSKKVFKKAIGSLYKKKLIQIEKDGIHKT